MKRISRSCRRLAAALLALALAAAGGPAAATTDTTAINPAILRMLGTDNLARSPREATVLTFAVAELGEDYAVIAWETDTEVAEEIAYGYLPSQRVPQLSMAMATRHRTTLTNLLRGTEYHYTIVGKEEVHGAFTTRGVPAPLYSTLGYSFPDPTTATFTWSTNVPTTWKFGWRREPEADYRNIVSGDRRGREHSRTLTGLRPETKYYFIIESSDSGGYVINTGERSFVTPENNVARGRPVRGTFTARLEDPLVQRDTDPLGNVTDGDENYFSGMAVSGDPADTDQWVSVDLGRARPLDRAVAVWRQHAYPKSFAVYGSVDGRRWERVAGGLNPETGASGYSVSGGTPWYALTVQLGGKSFRWLKLVVPKGSDYYVKHEQWRYVQLLELKVYPREQ